MLKLTLATGLALAALTVGALAADLPTKAAPVAAPAATDWDGAYIGATVGYDWAAGSSVFGSANPDGWLVGGQVGYNFHLSDQIVAGVQANLDWNNASGAATTLGTYSLNWDGALTARAGYDIDGILPYLEAGVAFANGTVSAISASETYTGWTAGAGVEFILADHLSTNIEYRYSNYGSQTFSSGPISVPVSLTDNQVRVGLNYHF